MDDFASRKFGDFPRGFLRVAVGADVDFDDFAYCFSWADWTRIRSVSQIIPSMAVHRSVTNGRVIVHGLVQLLLLLPRPQPLPRL